MNDPLLRGLRQRKPRTSTNQHHHHHGGGGAGGDALSVITSDSVDADSQFQTNTTASLSQYDDGPGSFFGGRLAAMNAPRRDDDVDSSVGDSNSVIERQQRNLQKIQQAQQKQNESKRRAFGFLRPSGSQRNATQENEDNGEGDEDDNEDLESEFGKEWDTTSMKSDRQLLGKSESDKAGGAGTGTEGGGGIEGLTSSFVNLWKREQEEELYLQQEPKLKNTKKNGGGTATKKGSKGTAATKKKQQPGGGGGANANGGKSPTGNGDATANKKKKIRKKKAGVNSPSASDGTPVSPTSQGGDFNTATNSTTSDARRKTASSRFSSKQSSSFDDDKIRYEIRHGDVSPSAASNGNNNASGVGVGGRTTNNAYEPNYSQQAQRKRIRQYCCCAILFTLLIIVGAIVGVWYFTSYEKGDKITEIFGGGNGDDNDEPTMSPVTSPSSGTYIPTTPSGVVSTMAPTVSIFSTYFYTEDGIGSGGQSNDPGIVWKQLVDPGSVIAVDGNSTSSASPPSRPSTALLRGNALDSRYGSAIALSSDGKVMAVGGPGINAADVPAGGGGGGPGGNNNGPNRRQVNLGNNGDGDGSDASQPRGGYVQVLKWNDDELQWTPLGRILNSSRDGDLFGISVDLNDDGSVIAIGAIGHDPAAGAVVDDVVADVAANSTQLEVDVTGEQQDGGGGGSNGNAAGDNAGSVFVFRYDYKVKDWVPYGSQINGNTQTNEANDASVVPTEYSFGRMVKLSGSGRVLAVLNAPQWNIEYHPTIVNSAGSYYVRIYAFDFDVNNSNEWAQVANDISIHNDDGDGTSVDIISSMDLSNDGTHLVLGSPHSADTTGAVFVYGRVGSVEWEQIAVLYGGGSFGDHFGVDVSLAGSVNGQIPRYIAATSIAGWTRVYMYDRERFDLELYGPIEFTITSDEDDTSVGVAGDDFESDNNKNNSTATTDGEDPQEQPSQPTTTTTMTDIETPLLNLTGSFSGTMDVFHCSVAMAAIPDTELVILAVGHTFEDDFQAMFSPGVVSLYVLGPVKSTTDTTYNEEAGGIEQEDEAAAEEDGGNVLMTYKSVFAEMGDIGDGFGTAISLSQNGRILAVGAPDSDNKKGESVDPTIHPGRVFAFRAVAARSSTPTTRS